MRVARTVGLYETHVEEVPDPVPGPGEVVCRVVACGICGSDVTDWYVRRKLPTVLGHEPVGVVEAVGEGVDRLRVGQQVAIYHHAPCGTCDLCRRNHPALCPDFRSAPLDPGGFAERVRLPAALTAFAVDSDGMDPLAVSFVEPLGCILRAHQRARLREGDRVLVVAAGSNGLLAIGSARALGAGAVYVSEPRPERVEQAVAWGAEPHDGQPVDVAIVCTPAPDAIRYAASALDFGGRLVLFAPPEPGQDLGIDGWRVFERELDVTASYSAGPDDFRAAHAMIASGAIDPAPLVSHRLPLEETQRGLEMVRAKEALKVVIEP
jgi:L-iditol 2-dehydrogenase